MKNKESKNNLIPILLIILTIITIFLIISAIFIGKVFTSIDYSPNNITALE